MVSMIFLPSVAGASEVLLSTSEPEVEGLLVSGTYSLSAEPSNPSISTLPMPFFALQEDRAIITTRAISRILVIFFFVNKPPFDLLSSLIRTAWGKSLHICKKISKFIVLSAETVV